MTTPEVALVTGASRGIGRATAERLAADGYQVVGTSRSGSPLDETIDMRPLDLTSDDSVNGLIAGVLADYGRIDLLVNNAAQTVVGPAEEVPIEQAQRMLDINYLGPIRLAQKVLPSMRVHNGGRLIFISSVGGLIGIPGQGQYCASKHALEGWADALGLEMRQFGIHVSLIEPGSYATDIITTSPRPDWPTIEEYNGYREHLMDSIETMTADGGDPKKVAAIVSKVARTRRPKMRYRTEMDGRMANFSRGVMPQRPFYNVLAKRFGAVPVAS